MVNKEKDFVTLEELISFMFNQKELMKIIMEQLSVHKDVLDKK
jgi:hypothetical protein